MDTYPKSLAPVPIDMSEHPGIVGTDEVAWSNRFLTVATTPSTHGPYVSLRAGDGSPFAGVHTLLTDGTRILMVRQDRWAGGVVTWEVPGGGIDHGEDPAEAAVRELREETGLIVEPEILQSLGESIVDPTRQSGVNHWFVGVLTEYEHAGADQLEIAEVAWVPVEQVITACVAGDIVSAPTVALVLRAWGLGLI